MKRETQRSKIKQHLESGQPITPIDALERYGCFRLAAIIHTLRHEDGMNIEKELIKNKFGTKYGKYTLIQEKHVFQEEEESKLKLLLNMREYTDYKIRNGSDGNERYLQWGNWKQIFPADLDYFQINSNINLEEISFWDEDRGRLFYYKIHITV
tara:strand:- start:234 stop:695 length:462 start_codon:yes stop_codon:yes gene_type:complete